MKILVFGTFDGLHPGHLFFLSQADKRGELAVIIARDVNVERIKGRRPEQSEARRRAAVQKAFSRARVLLGELDDFFLPVITFQPDLILLGYDQKLPPKIRLADFAEAGIAVERAEQYMPEKFKSSLLRKRQKR